MTGARLSHGVASVGKTDFRDFPRVRPFRPFAGSSEAAPAAFARCRRGLQRVMTGRPFPTPSVPAPSGLALPVLVVSAAVLGLAVPGIVVEDVDTVAKTMPEFTHLWAHMLADRVAAGA